MHSLLTENLSLESNYYRSLCEFQCGDRKTLPLPNNCADYIHLSVLLDNGLITSLFKNRFFAEAGESGSSNNSI